MSAPGIVNVLSIAGTDPTGGAGVQADLKAISAQGGYAMAVVTALVAQNTHGVRSVHVPPVSFLREQLDAVSDDVRIDAVKIGMLGTAEVIEAVRVWVHMVRPPVVVLDPVMVATSGDRLLDERAQDALIGLLSEADLITPNLAELAICAQRAVASTWEQAMDQARQVARDHDVLVLAKGGHLAGPDVPDALVGVEGCVEFPGRRVDTRNTHGTGCSLSSAVATRRARGQSWADAVRDAKRWLTGALAAADELDVGTGHGPVHHFAGLVPTPGPTAAEIATDWWEDIADIRSQIDALEFVTGLAEGTVPEDDFAWYLAQDTLYLRDYARALAGASVLAPTPTEQAFWARSAHAAVAAETAVHEQWVSAAAVEQTVPSPTTTGYLDHLLAPLGRGDYAELVAAVLPCFWLYQDIGTRLHAASSADHPYAAWLDAYGDPAFAESTREAIGVVTGCAARVAADDRERMKAAFRCSAIWEREFFTAPWRRAHP